MSASVVNVFSFTFALSIVTGVFLVGCSSNDPGAAGDVVPQSTGSDAGDTDSGDTDSGDTDSGDTDSGGEQLAGSEVNDFDGLWRTDCIEYRLFGVPEEDQPDGYIQRTLTVDSSAGTYSVRRQIYTDSECTIADPNKTATGVSGKIVFDGTTTTSSGLQATVVRYLNDGASPDLVGLLYREDNVLYREIRESTLIEDTVPTELSLSDPWRLVS